MRQNNLPNNLPNNLLDTPPSAIAMNRGYLLHGRTLLGIALLLGLGGIALAAIAPDVAKTRHNLSASNTITAAPGSSFGTTVKATSQTQLCVFCHTPHAATGGVVAPLWNRALSTATYTQFYTSSSLDSTVPTTVGDGSKLCLSCHDGTIAIGTIGVLNGAAGNIAMQGTRADGSMPDGAGENTGYTRRIGTNLSNDHPISFTYNAALATADGELNTPGAANVAVANRVGGQPKPQFPLLNNQLECSTCHDPHLKSDAIDPVTSLPINNKFLRGNRFQLVTPAINNNGLTPYNKDNDIICLACHNKPTWATSTHAHSSATSERYTNNAGDLRDFPRNTQVWQAACVNCHDMHTVPGARRLLREGTSSSLTPKVGGSSAIEQTCYQCHTLNAGILLPETPNQVPDIQSDFSLAFRMPIVNNEQGGGYMAPGGNTTEVHDISTLAASGVVAGGKDLMESPTVLGALANRHAECTDCHQPHRVTRTELFNGDPNIAAPSGTHNHTGTAAAGGSMHTNLASGSLRGGFGVEPVYGSASFYAEPVSFDVKRGPVTTNASTAVTNTYLTREYQVCANCHSNYAFGPLQGTIANPTNIPALGRTGGTPSATNGMQIYTNVFREIQAPAAHQGNAVTTDSGAFKGNVPYTPTYAVDFTINNRRSWHPVMAPTGRTTVLRAAAASNWLAPWNADIGAQTMYCTDCHGSNTAAATVVPTGGVDGNAWGPHGSNNIFLLKGWWDTCTGSNRNVIGATGCLDDPLVSTATVPKNTVARPTIDTTQDLCFKCHSYAVYAGGSTSSSGFGGGTDPNLHDLHERRSGLMRCMWCHVAVPHGWKNKALLVNLNDVGPEATCRTEDAADLPTGYKCTIGSPIPSGTQMRNGPLPQPGGSTDNRYWQERGYSNPPYYRNAMLKVMSFAPSGSWISNDCGSKGPAGSPGSGEFGGCGAWMVGDEGCSGPP